MPDLSRLDWTPYVDFQLQRLIDAEESVKRYDDLAFFIYKHELRRNLKKYAKELWEKETTKYQRQMYRQLAKDITRFMEKKNGAR